MSALHRLADPLIGYDSMEALAPKVRRRRQESIERVSRDCHSLRIKRSLEHSRPGEKMLRSTSVFQCFGCGISSKML